ncbi:hypothetical protein M432DRAFT_82989 [Thermoascus aurantiacus ATCC 26904]
MPRTVRIICALKFSVGLSRPPCAQPSLTVRFVLLFVRGCGNACVVGESAAWCAGQMRGYPRCVILSSAQVADMQRGRRATGLQTGPDALFGDSGGPRRPPDMLVRGCARAAAGSNFFFLKGIMPSPWTERALVFSLSLFFFSFLLFFFSFCYRVLSESMPVRCSMVAAMGF